MIAEPFLKKALTPQGGIGIEVTCAVLMAAILAVDLTVPLGIAVVILYIGVVLLAQRSRHRHFVLYVAIAASLFTVCPLFHKAPIDHMWKAVSNRMLALFTIWVQCYLVLQREAMEEKRETALRERENALQEVRVLRGFLPICASCKRIRSLEGAWTMLEKYITDHSEAEFSHGLCPDCTKKLFPQFFDKSLHPDEKKSPS